MNASKVIFIGPSGGGGTPKNGASAKNYHLINYFKEKGISLILIDTENWKKNPLILMRLALVLLTNPRAKFILAANNESSYHVLQIMSILPRKRHLIYWVIGGSIANWIKEGKVREKYFRIVKFFLVEGRKMQRTFEEIGITNSIYVPNFKHIEYTPIRAGSKDTIIRFVFLSRIIPEKGVDTIIEATKVLNKLYQCNFIVDFYGPIEEDYELEFKNKIGNVKNIEYKGFIDLRNQKNYELLAEYDAMLFPTYWQGEGFPGIIIDAFISGLPVIASDWSLNAEIITEGKTGFILNDNSPASLAEAMSNIINHPELLASMRTECLASAMNYDIKRVVSDELLKKIGIC